MADRYDFFNSDIFATNVIAKDPYTGRQVHLIDSRGYVTLLSVEFMKANESPDASHGSRDSCPVDLYVFPELHKTPDGALEAEFYAFKIPDSTFLVFQATVRTCRGPCEPVSFATNPAIVMTDASSILRSFATTRAEDMGTSRPGVAGGGELQTRTAKTEALTRQ